MGVLIAVAHGSRDPRSSRTVGAVVDRVRVRRPDLDVRVAYLDLTEPSVEQVIDEVAADGHESAAFVPLLLGNAFHARVDLPGILDAARRRHPSLSLVQAEVLGDDNRLVDALRARILGAGVDMDDPTIGVAVAAVGSSREAANRRTRALAARVSAGTGWAGAVTCFATNRNPGPTEAISHLTAAGARRIVIAPWFIAPGLLTDRVRDEVDALDIDVTHADVLGDHPFVADVVSARYDAAVGGSATRARECVAGCTFPRTGAAGP
ncbi:sirohydrochlorin chelatase [Rhodococcus sp. B10]|uniref:sirohydrochlorin chelatase n=1 Tax=Rhodococcus sp. B10 TaxID=2695876 RepID=UPI0014301EBD|nr:sirohydrochlorin chelatase [Rhodococcus sp. B10]NIL78478.1 Sirohydrochlorin cobaltochelatase [Rhodococcus sp. B10]